MTQLDTREMDAVVAKNIDAELGDDSTIWFTIGHALLPMPEGMAPVDFINFYTPSPVMKDPPIVVTSTLDLLQLVDPESCKHFVLKMKDEVRNRISALLSTEDPQAAELPDWNDLTMPK